MNEMKPNMYIYTCFSLFIPFMQSLDTKQMGTEGQEMEDPTERRIEAVDLKVNVEGMYEFDVCIEKERAIHELMMKIERHMGKIFGGAGGIKLLGLQDRMHRDVHPAYEVGDVFKEGDVVYPVRNVLETRIINRSSITNPSSIHTPEVSSPPTAPPDTTLGIVGGERVLEMKPLLLARPKSDVIIVHPQKDPGMSDIVTKCMPYCSPLSPFGVADRICPLCGEVVAYPPRPDVVPSSIAPEVIPVVYNPSLIETSPLLSPVASLESTNERERTKKDIIDNDVTNASSINSLAPPTLGKGVDGSGEVSPSAGSECTEHCLAGGVRKPRSQGLDFCSICLGRHRKGKYMRGHQHQCNMCHRPWLMLSSEGLCRSCHLSEYSRQSGGEPGQMEKQVPFRPNPPCVGSDQTGR